MSDSAKMKSRPSVFTRRAVVFGVLAAGGAAVFGAQWFNVSAQVTEDALSVQDAHKAALAQDIVLIDIRRPDEWARTGVGQGATPLDMRRDDFVKALLTITKGDLSRPIALICARGVRSRKMTARLQASGFTKIIDVPEGMLGSGAGPGWLRAGLPVDKI
ncbi:MAG: rhodanese-like domain-containing protein [Paracoccaceae bacterium]